MSDVPDGTGEIKFVSNAQPAGSSTLKESAFLFLINARPSTSQVPALLATSDTFLETENAQLLQLKPFLMLAVLNGTGTEKDVFNALKDGLSTPKESVCLFRTNVLLLAALELV